MKLPNIALTTAALAVSPVAALNVQTFDSFTTANAEVQGRHRYATPQGNHSGRPTNLPPTGLGLGLGKFGPKSS
jgi:hypothetical protein